MSRMACLVCVALALCRSALASECIQTFSDQANYFPSDVKASISQRSLLSSIGAIVDFAGLFSIDYGPTFKVLTERAAMEQYILVQCGAPNITDAEIDAVAALPTNYTRKTFTVPLRKVAATSTVQLSFLKELGLADRVEFASPYAVGSCWQKGVDCNAGYSSNVTIRASQDAAVDASFVDCMSVPCSSSSNSKEVHFSTSQDPGALNSAEHIKFLAAFFNKDIEAMTIFDQTVQAYNSLVVATPSANAPKVAWISQTDYAGPSWNQAAFKISLAGYKTRYVNDAGGVNVNASALQSSIGPNLTGGDASALTSLSGSDLTLFIADYPNKSSASAALFAALSDVDVVIDETYAYDPASYTFTSFLSTFDLSSSSSLPFITNQKVFRLDGTISEGNGLDWFESRLMHPQWFLADLHRALHGTGSSRKFLRNIAASETPQVVMASSCTTDLPACGDTASPAEIPLLHEPSMSDVSSGWRPAAPLLVSLLVSIGGQPL